MVEGVWGPGGGDETGWVNIEDVTEATTEGKGGGRRGGGRVLVECSISMVGLFFLSLGCLKGPRPLSGWLMLVLFG